MSLDRSAVEPTVERRWWVVVEAPDGATSELALERGPYVIGRDPKCAIYVNEREASRKHAVLERGADGHWSIVDQGSASGTYVNGARIDGSMELFVGDVVHLGGYCLELRSNAPTRRRDMRLPHVTGLAPPPRVRLYDAPMKWRELRLDRGIVVLGAGDDAALRLDSRRFGGVRIVLRPRKGGGFDVLDESDEPSLSVDGRALRRAELGAKSEDVTLRLGPIERQQRDSRDAVLARYMASERGPGQHTPHGAPIESAAYAAHREAAATAAVLEGLAVRAAEHAAAAGAPRGKGDGDTTLAGPATEPSWPPSMPTEPGLGQTGMPRDTLRDLAPVPTPELDATLPGGMPSWPLSGGDPTSPGLGPPDAALRPEDDAGGATSSMRLEVAVELATPPHATPARRVERAGSFSQTPGGEPGPTRELPLRAPDGATPVAEALAGPTEPAPAAPPGRRPAPTSPARSPDRPAGAGPVARPGETVRLPVTRPATTSPGRSPDRPDVAGPVALPAPTSPARSDLARGEASADRRPEATAPGAVGGRMATQAPGPEVGGAFDEGPSPALRPWGRVGAGLGAVVVACALLAWWLWPRPTPPELAAPTRPATSVTATEPAPAAAPSTLPAPSAPSTLSASSPRAPVAPPRSASPRTTAATAPPTKPPRGSAGEPGERDGDANDDAQAALLRRLEAKANAGKASTGELQQLLHLCIKQSSAACTERARVQLAQRREAP